MMTDPQIALHNSFLMKEIAALRNGIMRAQWKTKPEDIQRELHETLKAANDVRKGQPS